MWTRRPEQRHISTGGTVTEEQASQVAGAVERIVTGAQALADGLMRLADVIQELAYMDSLSGDAGDDNDIELL